MNYLNLNGTRLRLVGVGAASAALLACIGCYFFLIKKSSSLNNIKKSSRRNSIKEEEEEDNPTINKNHNQQNELNKEENLTKKMPNPNGQQFNYQENEQQQQNNEAETHSETSSDSGQGHSETHEVPSTLIMQNNLSPSSTNSLDEFKLDKNNANSSPTSSLLSTTTSTQQSLNNQTLSIPTQTIDIVVYEFYFPRKLCGKLIGKNGVHVDYIRTKTHASIAVRNDPTKPKDSEYQIVTVSGQIKEVDGALEILTNRFPAKFYPHISFKPISKPVIYRRKIIDTQKILVTPAMYVDLPPYQIDVHVSAIVSVNHVFIQLPTHPTYNLLQRLDEDMLHLYSSDPTIPLLNEPIELGTICAAPTSYGWHRAIVTLINNNNLTVKFLDYGGYLNLPLDQLRQLRNDFMTLPFQAIEVNIDGIQPIGGIEEDGKDVFSKLIKNKRLKAIQNGQTQDGFQLIKLFTLTDNFKVSIYDTRFY